MLPSDRKTELIVRLMSGKKLNTDSLSKEFGVNIRSIQRNIKDIREYFESNYKTYKLRVVKTGDFYHLSSDYDANSEIAFLFVSEIKGEQKSEGILLNLNYEKVNFNDIVLLKEAVINSTIITATYDKKGLRYPVTLEPYRVAFMEKFWYLIAVDSGDNNKIKTYRLSRLDNIVKTKESFKQNKEILNKAHLAINAWFSPDKKPFDVELLLVGDATKHFQNPPLQQNQRVVKESDGSVRIELSITHKMEIIPTILAWMPNIKVISPKFIADEIEEKVVSYAKDMGIKFS